MALKILNYCYSTVVKNYQTGYIPLTNNHCVTYLFHQVLINLNYLYRYFTFFRRFNYLYIFRYILSSCSYYCFYCSSYCHFCLENVFLLLICLQYQSQSCIEMNGCHLFLNLIGFYYFDLNSFDRCFLPNLCFLNYQNILQLYYLYLIYSNKDETVIMKFIL